MNDEKSATELPPLSRALDALPDGVVLLDADWTIGYINPAGAALLRRRPGDLTGHRLWAALPDLGGRRLRRVLRRARRTGAPRSWSGFCPPASRRLAVTVTTVDGLLQVSFRPAEPQIAPLDDVDRDTDRLFFLAEVSEAMIATLDTGESVTRLAELLAGRLCDWAIVVLAGQNNEVVEEAWAHCDPDLRADLDTYMRGRRRDSAGDSAMVNALLTGEPVQIPIDPALVAPSLPTSEVRDAWTRMHPAWCTIVPLCARGVTFGALALINADDRPPHSEAEIALAAEVARRGALALDNARLYEQQQTVAEKLQRSLLTDPPQPDDLELVVRYRPATSHMHVGGDWFDGIVQPDGATVAVIGDVVGHDVDAAATMGQIRSILRGIAYDRPDTPAEILTRVDSVLTGVHVAALATALVARIEQPDQQRHQGLRTLRWSSAGHLPPLLLHADGTVQVLASAPERLLGTGTSSLRSNHLIDLHPGDTLVLYTDGLVEHGRTGLDQGIARLAAVAAELHALAAEELCDRLLDRLLPQPVDDDVALLAIRCHPQPTPD